MGTNEANMIVAAIMAASSLPKDASLETALAQYEEALRMINEKESKNADDWIKSMKDGDRNASLKQAIGRTGGKQSYGS